MYDGEYNYNITFSVNRMNVGVDELNILLSYPKQTLHACRDRNWCSTYLCGAQLSSVWRICCIVRYEVLVL